MQFSNLNESVSVVIPGYNVASYIEASLASVYAQTHKPREVICINDGSTDDTLALLHRLQNIYPDLIIIDQPNGGACSARNAGLHAATGTWVQFFDGDDVILTQIAAGLHLDQHHRQFAGVFQTVFFAQRDEHRLVFAHQ